MTAVVIMAGGRGLRLHPLTEHAPKPMIRIGHKPMLQTILEGFIEQGFARFILCVNYKRELIEGYFGDGSAYGCWIDYVREPEPLGTAGALKLLPKMDGPFIVSNADVLTRIDYADLVEKHRASRADATMCLALHQYQVPYGVPRIEGGYVAGIDEKPINSWPVNAGVYVIEPGLLDYLPAGPCDMPDLLKQARVATYEIEGHWLDVGTFQSLEAARAMV